MIYKRCPRCGARIPTGTICEPCEKARRKTANSTDGVRKQYKTRQWEKERRECLERFDYVDLYALYHENQVTNADRVHHIVEALDAPELFHDPANHFPVSDWSHHEIHRRYKMEGAEPVQNELRSYMARWTDEINH